MRELRFDVVISGAGPAGSSTALRLARGGASVAIVEARRFPRFKPCGEFMSPECLPMLRDLGVDEEIRSLGAREVRGMVLHGHGRRTTGRFVDVGRARAPFDYGWAVRREVFDDVLLRAARREGVAVMEACRATELLVGSGGIVQGLVAREADGSETAVRARWTLGADGVRSRVAEALGVRRDVPWLRKLALTTRYTDVEWGECAEVHFLERGYFACAPVDGGRVSVNLVVECDFFEEAALARDEFFEDLLSRVPSLAERLGRGRRSDPIRGTGPLAARTTSQTFDGAALVGDACGYVDPVTGEGLYFALRGGEMLAASVEAALRARRIDRGALSGYRAGRRRELGPRAALGLLFQRGMKHPAIVRGAMGMLERRPRLADVLVSVTGDYVPFRELARLSTWLGSAVAREGAA